MILPPQTLNSCCQHSTYAQASKINFSQFFSMRLKSWRPFALGDNFLAFRVVSVSGLHGQLFLPGGKMDFVIAASSLRPLRSVSEVILIAQLLNNLAVNLLD